MNVEVDDEHALHEPLGLQDPNRDGEVVVDAEPLAGVAFGVVPPPAEADGQPVSDGEPGGEEGAARLPAEGPQQPDVDERVRDGGDDGHLDVSRDGGGSCSASRGTAGCEPGGHRHRRSARGRRPLRARATPRSTAGCRSSGTAADADGPARSRPYSRGTASSRRRAPCCLLCPAGTDPRPYPTVAERSRGTPRVSPPPLPPAHASIPAILSVGTAGRTQHTRDAPYTESLAGGILDARNPQKAGAP